MRAVQLLRQLADDGRAGGIGEPLELAQVLVEQMLRAASLERRADEDRGLLRRRERDQVTCDGGVPA
jgi:hypothetical protein